MNYNNYKLIGIGEFSHGIQESWEYRFDLLKKVIKETNKKITIFQELSIWQGDNIMNNTYYDKNKDKFIKHLICLIISSQYSGSHFSFFLIKSLIIYYLI